jgi:hypothetical protein
VATGGAVAGASCVAGATVVTAGASIGVTTEACSVNAVIRG